MIVLRNHEAVSHSGGSRSLRGFANAIPTLGWIANADGWITWYNRQWYEYTGTTPEQMEGWGWQSVHDPTVLPEVMERWTGSIATGKPFQMVFPLRGADGVYRAFLTRVVPAQDESGRLTEWFGTNTEIDELQRTREALEQSEQELRYTIELNPQIPWSADAQGNITGFSARWLEVTGLSHEEALGEGWLSIAHPDDRPRMRSAWLTSVRSGSGYDIEHRIKTASGAYTWRRTRAFPRVDAHGNVIKWYGTTEDIDEQKRTEESLRASEARLRLALMAGRSMGTFDWDVPSNQIVFDLAARNLFGFGSSPDTDSITIEAFFDRIHTEDRERMRTVVQRTLDGDPGYTADYRILLPDGTLRWISANGTCYYGADGRPVRFLGVCLDITDRKRTEQALIQNEKLAAVGRLAASIAHEINNPLESITNLLYLAKQGTRSAEVRRFLETAEDELRRVAIISNDTLRFNRQSTRAAAVTCQALFLSTLSMFQGRLRNSAITVEQRQRGQHPVRCFEGEIRQVLGNLIGNAIDAMAAQPGRLLLRSREGRQPGGARGFFLTVADTGPGMAQSTVTRIFEPFFTTKETTGTGLGLWISRDIIDRHHGTLRVRSSQRPGRAGTVFRIFLPSEG